MALVRTLVLIACGLTAACSEPLPPAGALPGTDDGGGGAGDDGGADIVPVDAGDNGAASDAFPADHPAPPQVVRESAGKVLAAPRFVPVFFAGDDAALAGKAVDFETRLGPSDYWKQTTAEYGVGPATATAPVMLAEMASGTIDDSKVRTWLQTRLNGGDPAFPAVEPDDIFILHYPTGVTITLTSGGTVSRSCREFGAYHSNIRLDANHKSQKVAYAVIPRCRGGGGGGTTLDLLTNSVSHELTEAATDPYPQSGAAYYKVDVEHLNWMALNSGGEVSDMCQTIQSSTTRPSELSPYALQRGWSNAAALAGHDPCVPAPATPYFAAAPVLPDVVDYVLGNQTVGVLGVNIPLGDKRTIELDLFSDGPTPRFVVNARNYGRGNYLSFSLDRNAGVNGEKLHLTIKSNLEAPNLAADFIVTATLNGAVHSWYGVVGQVPP